MFDPDEILRTLHRHRVEFVLIGGMAATLHGDGGAAIEGEPHNSKAAAANNPPAREHLNSLSLIVTP